MPPVVASLLAADLIRSARDEHVSFEVRRHPDPVLLRALSRYQRELVARLIRADNTQLYSAQETALPLAAFDAGITLPDFKYPGRVEVKLVGTAGAADTWVPVDLVSWFDRFQYRRAAYIRSNTLFLTGAAIDWTPYAAVRIHYVPEVDSLTSLSGASGTLVVPNAAEPCLVAYLVWFMAKRGHGDEGVAKPDPAAAERYWLTCEQSLLDALGRRKQAVMSKVREVF